MVSGPERLAKVAVARAFSPVRWPSHVVTAGSLWVAQRGTTRRSSTTTAAYSAKAWAVSRDAQPPRPATPGGDPSDRASRSARARARAGPPPAAGSSRARRGSACRALPGGSSATRSRSGTNLPRVAHQVEVLGPPVVVVAGNRRRVPVPAGREVVPDRLASSVFVERALDLDRGGRNAPDHRGGRSTANGSVISSCREPKRDSAGGRPPLGPVRGARPSARAAPPKQHALEVRRRDVVAERGRVESRSSEIVNSPARARSRRSCTRAWRAGARGRRARSARVERELGSASTACQRVSAGTPGRRPSGRARGTRSRAAAPAGRARVAARLELLEVRELAHVDLLGQVTADRPRASRRASR